MIDLIADIETDKLGMNISFTAEEEGPLAQYKKRRRLEKRMVETTAVKGSRSRRRRTVAHQGGSRDVCRSKGHVELLRT
jgi:hypothetical protein